MASLPLCSNGFLRPTFKELWEKNFSWELWEKKSIGIMVKNIIMGKKLVVGAVGKKSIGTSPDDEEEVEEEVSEEEVDEEGILITIDPYSSSSNSGDDDGEPKDLRLFKCNMPNCKDEHYQICAHL
ncbi:hypothetical protein CASFOL_033870 [Castilleja foliolosa]|uniref:Uncharacterized protein n=1 Tax=Castilleja foliolosa TaxID=1961234 RepID=A0ABD3BZ07_9LAMI